jgi:hypothetical protein
MSFSSMFFISEDGEKNLWKVMHCDNVKTISSKYLLKD